VTFTFDPIGVIHSCYKEKFGIPRQPGLVTEARATLELLPPYNREEAVRGLEGFSHLWVVFVFHASLGEQWKPTVRPPRLGGNRRLGVFATRSPVRPNPIGLSVVALEKIVCEGGRVELHLKGIDLLDGTPVLDIKPYVPYVDSIPGAAAGFAEAPPAPSFRVRFSPQAREVCETVPGLEALIGQILSQDPRPAYYGKGGGKHAFGMRLLDYDVRWEVDGETVVVTGIAKAS
jgi:tRNA-Thr(GGU) m(6)t(6)A37 methyltransferase TsaA